MELRGRGGRGRKQEVGVVKGEKATEGGEGRGKATGGGVKGGDN